MYKNIIIIRTFLWLILAVATAWLVYLKIAPTGKISYAYDFNKPSYFIGKLAPAERVIISRGAAEIKGDPVYFSLRTPRRFKQAKVTIEFKNTTDFPIMEIGLLNNKIAWSYDLKPLENKIIDQLALVWPAVKGPNGERLIEREKKYDAIEKFLSDLPARREIALYNYRLPNKFLIEKYAPKAETRLYDYNFRGSYQFYTYIKNEELDYVFDFIDLNVNKDDDAVDIKVYSPDGLIYGKRIADDEADGGGRQAGIKLANLPEAVYRLSFIANDDIITKKIVSRQSQFALINKVWLAQGNKKNLVLYTNSRLVSAQTINPASLGKVKVGASAIDLNGTYRQFSLKTVEAAAPEPALASPSSQEPGGVRAVKSGQAGVKIELPKDDIIISGDGVFSFDQDGLLDPRLKIIDGNTDINREKINYILTNYDSPAEFMEWRAASADFDLTKAYEENGKYQFLISLPGLKAEETNRGAVIIKEIRVDLSGASLRQKIGQYFNR